MQPEEYCPTRRHDLHEGFSTGFGRPVHLRFDDIYGLLFLRFTIACGRKDAVCRGFGLQCHRETKPPFAAMPWAHFPAGPSFEGLPVDSSS